MRPTVNEATQRYRCFQVSNFEVHVPTDTILTSYAWMVVRTAQTATLPMLVIFIVITLIAYPWTVRVMWLPICSRHDAFSSTLCTISNFAACMWPGQRLFFEDCRATKNATLTSEDNLADYMALLDIQKLWASTMANHTLAHVDVAFDLHTAACQARGSFQELVNAHAQTTVADDTFSSQKTSAFLQEMKKLAQGVISIYDDVAFILEAFVTNHFPTTFIILTTPSI